MSRNSDENYGALWLLTPTVLLYVATFFVPIIMLGVLSFARFEMSVTTIGFYFDNYIKTYAYMYGYACTSTCFDMSAHGPRPVPGGRLRPLDYAPSLLTKIKRCWQTTQKNADET